MNDETIDILLALLFGFVLKILDLVYHEDAKHPDQPIDLWKYLFGNSNKWRILSSVIMILGSVFLLPLAVFELLRAYDYQGIKLGLAAIAVVGYSADDFAFFKYYLYKRTIYNRLTTLLKEENHNEHERGTG